jgi:hypothetical protein
MELPEPSKEQSNIIDLLQNGNVIIDSVAGSGKTTTNLHIANRYKNNNILLLTYNAKLKIETRQKVIKNNITNLETHSYHSFCCKYYDNKCYNDTMISQIIKKDTFSKDFKYDIIILDEAQDINPLYYQLIYKIYNDNVFVNAKLCILGDRKQSIYDFNQADPRFIIYADQLFDFNNIQLNWSKCHLTTSFRITNTMSDFINNCMIKQNRINSNKITNFKPRYIICDSFGNSPQSIPFNEIKYYLDLGYQPDQIFILAPSIRSPKSPSRMLENKIKTLLPHIPVYVPTSDDEKLDEQVLQNKMVFSTFHQSKGLEREVVIIFNFDDSYFHFYKKDADPYECPNEFYVATTRAKEHLTLFHHHSNNYLPFLDRFKLGRYCNFIEHKSIHITKIMEKRMIDTSVTELTRHLPQKIIDDCINYFEKVLVNKKDEHINIPVKTLQKYGYENVSEITGIAIPSYYQYIKLGYMDIWSGKEIPSINQIKNNESDQGMFVSDDETEEIKPVKKTLFDYFKKKEEKSDVSKLLYVSNNFEKLDASKLLYVANKWNSEKTGYIYKMQQIDNYDWLSEVNLDKCLKRMNKLDISNSAKFEKKINVFNRDELLGRRLIGYLDCYDKNDIYEFKCVSELSGEHFLQLAIYMYINEHVKNNNKKENVTYMMDEFAEITVKKDKKKDTQIKMCDTNYYLYNILTDEKYLLKATKDNLKLMMEYLIYNKYLVVTKLSNEEFITNMKKNITNLSII